MRSVINPTKAGSPSPLGTLIEKEGVNFALFSRHATRVRLEFFNRAQDARPDRAIDLDVKLNRTGDVWHVWVRGIRPGQLYAYRVDGPYDPKAGHRFNFNKILLDPCAKAITPLSQWDFDPARGYDPSVLDGDLIASTVDDTGNMPKNIVIDDHFDWQEDAAPRHPFSELIIYETHVRGFSIDPSSGAKYPGTYRGLTEKIPYFKELGITAVELLPIHEFNESQVTSALGKSLKNYWGYDPVLFMAPKASYSSAREEGGQVKEFKEMVRAFHLAGIEVILDVVFNHTAETDTLGPTLSFRGIDNSVFYLLEDDKRFYKNFSGTGNAVNANHPDVQEQLLMALRYWAQQMHVDGFRFDLASILSRDCGGHLLQDAPLLQKISEDPVLKEVKIIAEPWDAAGAYQLGCFSTRRWAEWNDRFRDEVRRFWRGDEGMMGHFASRICGSADIFGSSGKSVQNSINFITCHDGFTLNDLVSYRYKHNQSNKQDNNDGTGENFSEHYGVEGPSSDAAIESIRVRQIKNFLFTLFIARGVPMMLGGDEFRRTQEGNNNAYCQDNEISWYDWSFLGSHKEILDFTRVMIAFRKAHPVLSKEQFYTEADVQWFNPQGTTPNWLNSQERQLACLVHETQGHSLYLMFNAGFDAIDFRLPSLAGARWQLAVDTFHQPPQNLQQDLSVYRLNPRSSAVLLANK